MSTKMKETNILAIRSAGSWKLFTVNMSIAKTIPGTINSQPIVNPKSNTKQIEKTTFCKTLSACFGEKYKASEIETTSNMKKMSAPELNPR